MLRLPKTATALLAATLLLLANAPAHAVLVFQDAAGNTVSAPAVLDGANEAVYFTETAIPGGGRYTVTNNSADYGLIAFGISNSFSIAWIESFGDSFGCGSDSDSSWCYFASNLDGSNWDTESIDFDGNSGQDIFGDISNVLDPGDDVLNFYTAADGELLGGDTWDQFLFETIDLASQLFVVLSGPGGTIYGSGGTPVPEPGTALLVASCVAGLAVRRCRQR